jgi:hypothetical protein
MNYKLKKNHTKVNDINYKIMNLNMALILFITIVNISDHVTKIVVVCFIKLSLV